MMNDRAVRVFVTLRLPFLPGGWAWQLQQEWHHQQHDNQATNLQRSALDTRG